ncbi:MAG: outer membrane protein assembly factor BamD [Thermoguttaceae bacterium]
MTQVQILRRLITLVFTIFFFSTGCAGGPAFLGQVDAAATKDPFAGAKTSVNQSAQTRTSQNQQVISTIQGQAAPSSNQAPIAQSGAIQPASAVSSPVLPVVAVETLAEDNSGGFPISVLPPAEPIRTAPPQALPDPPATPASTSDPLMGKDKESDFWNTIAPENLYKGMKKAVGKGPNEAVARAAFSEGRELFKAKKYSEAVDKFKLAADRWPGTPLEEDALFMLAESYFFSDRYSKAHDTYSELFKKYNNTRHLDVAVQREFALGRYWVQCDDYKHKWALMPNLTDNSQPTFDTFGYAIKAFQNVHMYDPTGPWADDSIMAAATAYFRRGEFENAAVDFDLLFKEYPSSEHQKAAHILDMQAKMRIYQGKYYDPTALQEAGEIADQTLAQFGSQLGAEQSRVAKARRQIQEEKANRDFAMAEYYEKQKSYGAARLYYQGIVQNYPSTEKAQQARIRLEAIKGFPAEAPSRLKWLSDMFHLSKTK